MRNVNYQEMMFMYKDALSRKSVKYLMTPEYRQVMSVYLELITAYYEYRTKQIYIIYQKNKEPKRILFHHDTGDISPEELDVLLLMREL